MVVTPNYGTINVKQSGENLSHLMRQHGYSIKDLADYLGVSDDAIKNWRCGKNCPTTEHLIKICCLFNVDAREVISLSTREK